MRDVHWTVDYQQIENGNIANQIHGFTIDYGKFILIDLVSDVIHGYWVLTWFLISVCFSVPSPLALRKDVSG